MTIKTNILLIITVVLVASVNATKLFSITDDISSVNSKNI